MDLHVLVSFIFPEPAMNPSGRRGEGTIGVILSSLVVQFVAFKIIGTWFLIWLSVELKLDLSRRLPCIDHGRPFLHVIFDLDSLARRQSQVLRVHFINPRLRRVNSSLYRCCAPARGCVRGLREAG